MEFFSTARLIIEGRGQRQRIYDIQIFSYKVTSNGLWPYKECCAFCYLVVDILGSDQARCHLPQRNRSSKSPVTNSVGWAWVQLHSDPISDEFSRAALYRYNEHICSRSLAKFPVICQGALAESSINYAITLLLSFNQMNFVPLSLDDSWCGMNFHWSYRIPNSIKSCRRKFVSRRWDV